MAVGARGSILLTKNGGRTWTDAESPVTVNLYDIKLYSRSEAIAVGALGSVIQTKDGGKTWQIQPNITSNSLQAVEYQGGTNLWVAGRGGSILKRFSTLAPLEISSPIVPPVLRRGGSKKKLRPLTPRFVIADDGDIPVARKPKENN